MPIENYGVLKGVPDRAMREPDGSSPHYQVRVLSNGEPWRLAINVKSTEKSPGNPEALEVLYRIDDDYQHAILPDVRALAEGFTRLRSREDGPALDFIRANLFRPSDMRHLPANRSGAQNDLQDLVDLHVSSAIRQKAEIYAFGSAWLPGGARQPADGRFDTDQGVHDIHMNQGNSGTYRKDNGPWQDGALLMYFPASERWVATFLAFQSQAWHTDDRTGDPIEPSPERPQVPVRVDSPPVEIVGALVNPTGDDVGKEVVLLLNTSSESVSLDGWAIADTKKKRDTLHGILAAGESRSFVLSGGGAQLSNQGGIITLLDSGSLKVDGVFYTKEQAAQQGRTIAFRR